MTQERILALVGLKPKSPEAGVLRLLIELGVESCGADEGSLLVYDREQNDLVFAMTTNESSESALLGQRVPLGVGVSGRAAQTLEAQSGTPVFKDIEQADMRRGVGGEPSAVIAAPMIMDDELIGVLTAVSFDAAVRFRANHLRTLSRAATVAAVVVEQRRALSSLAVLRQGDALPPARTDEEREARRLGALVAELSANAGPRAGALVTMVEALVALTKR